MSRWACECGWRGDEPSITDASVEVELTPGITGWDRTHVMVCPECFANVHRAPDCETCGKPMEFVQPGVWQCVHLGGGYAGWSKRDEADARGDWEYHRRKDDRGPPEAA